MCYATKGEGNSGVGLLPLEDLDASRLSKLFSMSDSREASSALAFELSQHRTEATMLCKRCVAKLVSEGNLRVACKTDSRFVRMLYR
jgi:hypothetical protein